jgi:hypothetical protein
MDAPAWRIEVLDARAGLAFASWRDERSEDGDVTPEEGLVLFVGAPDFRPEPVGNLALALGAGRATFQTGLFVGKTEVSFSSPDAVAAFVRRAYVSSQGGDGNDAGGGTVPPPIPPDTPPLPPFELPEAQASERWKESLEFYRHHVRSLSLGASKATGDLWPDELDGEVHDMLARGALLVLLELLRRVPTSADATFVKWLRLVRAFSAQLGSLGLWPILTQPALVRVIEGAVGAVRLPFSVPARFDVKARMLFSGGPSFDDPDGIHLLEEIARNWPSEILLYMATSSTGSGGQFEDASMLLSELPVPAEFRSLTAERHFEESSLFHFLAIALAGPATALQGVDHRHALDVMLFCAGCITARAFGHAPYFAFAWRNWRRSRDATKLEIAEATEAAREAWDWLREQLPEEAFAERIEQVIFGARNLRYGDPPVSGGRSGPPPLAPMPPRTPSSSRHGPPTALRAQVG